MKLRTSNSNIRQVGKNCVWLLALSAVCTAVPAWSDVAVAKPLVIEWNTNLTKFQLDHDKFVGQRFTFQCPERTVRDKDATLYGTDTYPSNNPICVAAMHAGAVTAEGGIVQVQLNPGASAYEGTLRNGVQSASLPQTQRGFVFIMGANIAADEVQRAYAPRVKWDTRFTRTGLANRNLVGQRFTFVCPAASGNSIPRQVYGTDQYAFNSLICQTAVHAGKITHAGGTVTVQLDEGTQRLVGSIRHGIESKDGPGGSPTLSFVDPIPMTLSQASN